MFNPLIIGLIVFVIILTGAFAGWAIRRCLPEHHLADETKSLVSVSMAVMLQGRAEAAAPAVE